MIFYFCTKSCSTKLEDFWVAPLSFISVGWEARAMILLELWQVKDEQ
jgi:hypothetical protein